MIPSRTYTLPYPIDSKKHVDIKFSAHDVFLESPSPGALNVERLEIQIIFKSLGWIKTKGSKRDSQSRLMSSTSDEYQ